jgi:hypothetical protein
MGLARPKGLIFDSGFGPELLSDELLQRFGSDTVFLKGISEDVPVTIYHSADVLIDEDAKRPLSRIEWATKEGVYTLKDLKGPLPRPNFELDDLKDPSQIQVKVLTRDPNGTYATVSWDYRMFEHSFEAGKHLARVTTEPIPALVKKWGIWRNNEEITIQVLYPKRPAD